MVIVGGDGLLIKNSVSKVTMLIKGLENRQIMKKQQMFQNIIYAINLKEFRDISAELVARIRSSAYNCFGN